MRDKLSRLGQSQVIKINNALSPHEAADGAVHPLEQY
jgi:hypothetical protein